MVRIFNKFQLKQPEVLKNSCDFTLNKLKIIDEIKNDQNENKWLKKIIVFGLKKIKLDDVDFNKEYQNFYNIIKEKTIQSLKDISEPSKKSIWIAIAIQWMIFMFIWFTKF